MKKLIASTILTGVLAFGSAVSAEETVEVTEPGTTPDSFLFTFDQLMEKFQLMMTFDDEKEAQLLLDFANERLAEAGVMSEEEKTDYVQKALEEYMLVLDQATDKVAEVIVEENTDAEGAEELTEELETVSDAAEEVVEDVEGELQEEVEEATQEAQAVANVVRNLDQEKVAELREQSLGYGQIAQIFWLAEASGLDVEEIAALYTEEKAGFGKAAKQLGLHPSQMKGLANRTSPEEVEEEEGTEDDNAAGEDGTAEEGTTEEGNIEEGVGTDGDQPEEEGGTEEDAEEPAADDNATLAAVSTVTTVKTIENKASTQKSAAKAEEKKAEAVKKAEEKKLEATKKAEEKQQEAAKKAKEKKQQEKDEQEETDETEETEEQTDSQNQEDTSKGKGKKDNKK